MLMLILPKMLFNNNNSVTYRFLGVTNATCFIDTPCNTYENVYIKNM